MAKVEKYICDINNCQKEASKKNKKMNVIFHTEQTEGRSVKPYLSLKDIDLCDTHYSQVIQEDRNIHATGAQGHNRYYFKKQK